MEARDRARTEAIGRLGKFCITNAEDWTPKRATATTAQANAQALVEQLNTEETGIIARLGKFSTGQESGAADFHGGVTSKSTQRNGIMLEMKNWNEAAGAFAKKLGKPEIMDGFRMPHGVSDEKLAAVALSFAEKAEPWEEEFLKLGMDEDFIQELKDRVKAFREAKDDKSEGLQDQVGAGGGLDATIEEGLTVMAQLVVLLKNFYKHEPDKLAALLTATHVQRTRKKKKPKTEGDASAGAGAGGQPPPSA